MGVCFFWTDLNAVDDFGFKQTMEQQVFPGIEKAFLETELKVDCISVNIDKLHYVHDNDTAVLYVKINLL